MQLEYWFDEIPFKPTGLKEGFSIESTGSMLSENQCSAASIALSSWNELGCK
jgi:hypothetical protein